MKIVKEQQMFQDERVVQFSVDLVVGPDQDSNDEYIIAKGLENFLNKNGYEVFSVTPMDDVTDYYEEFRESKVIKEDSLYDNIDFDGAKNYEAERLASDIYNFYCEYESEINETGMGEMACLDWDILESEVNSYYGDVKTIRDKLLSNPDSVIMSIKNVGYEYEKEGYDESVDYARELISEINDNFK